MLTVLVINLYQELQILDGERRFFGEGLGPQIKDLDCYPRVLVAVIFHQRCRCDSPVSFIVGTYITERTRGFEHMP